MKKILFLMHDLGQGGAEKVLVNLVNHMNREKYDITVVSLFAGGVNEQFLLPDIRYKTVFSKVIPGNSKLMKIFTPKQLHNMFIKGNYDIEVAYLEGPVSRVISGCQNKDTKLVSWIHSKQSPINILAASFRSANEAKRCYERFDQTIFVAEGIKSDFCETINYQKSCRVLYNTVESDVIEEKSKESVEIFSENEFKIIAVGTLKEIKGYDRLLRIVKRLKEEDYPVHLYILGIGPLQKMLEEYIIQNKLENQITLLGYQINPYKYVAKCDLFVCSSYSEGFSTATTEALIVGTPVCTVEVSGMREMLGENSEYGFIVPNEEEALYDGIKKLICNKELLNCYRLKAKARGQIFSTEQTVRAVEEMFEELYLGGKGN